MNRDISISVYILLHLALSPLGYGDVRNGPETQEKGIALIEVNSGKIEILKENEYHFTISLNGKAIHENHSFIVDIYRFYKGLGGYSVLLLSEISGGNICEAFSFRFIAWKPDGTYQVSESFGNCKGPLIKQMGEKLILFFESYLGEYSKKKHPSETWIYENGHLRRIAK